MYRKDRLDDLMNHFQEYMLFTSSLMEKTLLGIENNELETVSEIVQVDENIANNFESQIEEEAITFLALNEAEASILRTIIMIIKMNNDLERICDNISNICGSASKLIKEDYENTVLKDIIAKMITKSIIMLKDVNYAFLNRDLELCDKIIANDDDVDKLHSKLYKLTLNEILEAPEDSKSILRYNRMSKNIERGCDLITNIAEDIIFLISGKDVKHNQPVD